MALLQHKQDLVTAIKAQQYTAAAAVLETALAVAPQDAMLLEFHSAVQAKLRHDHGVGSSSDDGKSECSQNSACASEADDDSGSTDEERDCSASGSDDVREASSADPAPSTAAVAAVGAAVDGKFGQGGELAQLQHALQDLSQQESSLGAKVSSISLAASSCKLTRQHRLQLRQQLAASINKQKDELVQQQLVKSAPLLAAV